MKKLIILVMALPLMLNAQDFDQELDSAISEISDSSVTLDSASLAFITELKSMDSIGKTLRFETGEIVLGNGIAKLTVPAGYKYLNPEQSKQVLTKLWGNPPSETWGMVFPDSVNPTFGVGNSFAIEISYLEEGYVEDDDAEDLDYEELLSEMKKDIAQASVQREAMGYGKVKLIGWASAPFYDNQTKKLHWAKEIQFGEDGEESNTLNYDIRILGRKGILSCNVIAGMEALPLVQANIDQFISSAEFSEGYTYEEFDSSIDEVAAYGIGGLIAGKVLAKAGFFVLLAKFWKFIAIGAVAAFAGVKKFFKKDTIA